MLTRPPRDKNLAQNNLDLNNSQTELVRVPNHRLLLNCFFCGYRAWTNRLCVSFIPAKEFRNLSR
jgi:hypothetical protein